MMGMLVCLTFASCYLRVFVLPKTPIMFWGDALLFAMNGARMVAGHLPYRDYFLFLPPGTDLLYSSLFRFFGRFLWIPNLVMACLAAVTCLLTTLCARRVVRDSIAALSGLIFAGFVLYGSLDATHHWFSTVAIMAAVLVLMNGVGSFQVATAGALCGVAASFTQSKGASVVAGFVVYLIWQARQETSPIRSYWHKCLLLCGMAAIAFLVINGHYIEAAGGKQWLDCVIIFPIRYYPSIPINNWRAPWLDFQQQQVGFLRWVCAGFMYATVPLVYVIFAWSMPKRWKTGRSEPWDQLILIAIAGFAMFLAVAPSLSLKRTSSVSPPAVILLGWLLSQRQRRTTGAAYALGAVSLALALYLPLRTQVQHWNYIDLPAGRVAIRDRSVYELYSWLAERSRPGEMYFGPAAMAFPLRLQNPAPIDAPLPWEYTRPEQVAEAIAAIEKNCVPLMVLRPYMYTPRLFDQNGDHLEPFRIYLYRNYRRTKLFSTGDEVWERLDACRTAASS
jgi:hypothetical protein